MVLIMKDIKSAEERKFEIIVAASELFAAKGYDHTSINDILEKVGIAKGTLYYHYKSKEEILDALIEYYGTNAIKIANQIAADKSLPVVERIVKIIVSININVSDNSAGKEVIEQIQRPQNALMRQKSKKFTIKEMLPIITKVLTEGIEQGIFNTEYLTESVEMILVYVSNVFDDNITDLTETELMKRAIAFIYNMERLLGAETGGLRLMTQIFDKGRGA